MKILVDEYGAGETKSPARIRFQGDPICVVDEEGVAEGGSTIEDIRRRGIDFFCPVDENGEAAEGSTLSDLAKRGISGFCVINEDGTPTPAPGVTPIFLYDEDGNRTVIDPLPLAPEPPVITLTSGATDLTPDFSIVFDSGPFAGDVLRLYDATLGLLVAHTITAGEESGDPISLGLSPLSAGSYVFYATHGRDGHYSAASNSQSITLTDLNGRLLWGTDQMLWDSDRMLWS